MISVSYFFRRSSVGQLPRCGQLLLALGVLGATACGEPSSSGSPNDGGAGESGNPPEEAALTGTFTFGGETLDCETSDQDFPATGEYSVLCENDDDPANYR